MATTFQPPKGTRDFYPDSMALRRYIEDTWRKVSLRHGFLEVDGPTFEYLDLYKVKSGDEIVSQLFHFTGRPDKDGKADHYALRPELTPTVARMIADKANALPRPIKWFSIPRCYRGETPQKGRLREFIQWNVDIVGDASAGADQECLAVCVDVLREFGLTEKDVRIGWNHRGLMTRALLTFMQPERIPMGFEILDKLYKLSPHERQETYAEKKCLKQEIEIFEALAAAGQPKSGEDALRAAVFLPEEAKVEIIKFTELLQHAGLGGYATWDVGVVRGIAYYTGFVFEVFDRSPSNPRAVAGGGRYDNLIELFGGPPMPAIGFGMGDVVIRDVLAERNLLPASLLPRPAVFVINALEDQAVAIRLLAALRQSLWNPEHTMIVREGLHAITSYRATKNIGKILQDASASGARFAIILAPNELARGIVKVKDLANRQECEVPAEAVVDAVHQMLRGQAPSSN